MSVGHRRPSSSRASSASTSYTMSPASSSNRPSTSTSGRTSRSGSTPSTPSTLFNPGESPNIFFSRPRAPSPYMRTLLTYIDAVNKRDFEAMEGCFDEALEHRILPRSLERPVLTKRLYGEYWRGVMSLFEKFETKVIEVIEAGDKMTVHSSFGYQLAPGARVDLSGGDDKSPNPTIFGRCSHAKTALARALDSEERRQIGLCRSH